MYSYPNSERELLSNCPVCESTKVGLKVHDSVEDWSFNAIEGEWTYMLCEDCESLYLNPRPKEEYIMHAYSQYYTHIDGSANDFVDKLENEIIYHWLKVEQGERLNKSGSLIFKTLKSLVFYKHPLIEILKSEPGTILDIGCGNGKVIQILSKLGWEVCGIEIDEKAAKMTREKGITVHVGSHLLAKELKDQYDVVIASHVIEHVYDPQNLLEIMLDCTKKGGNVFLTYPNPKSIMHKLFGKHWRGLEAPRHISLPSISRLKYVVEEKGHLFKHTTSSVLTFWGSYKMRFNRSSMIEGMFSKVVQLIPTFLIPKKYTDIVQIRINKN